MNTTTVIDKKQSDVAWTKLVRPYQTPLRKTSLWQIFSTFVPLFLLWYLMVLSLDIHYLVTLLLAIPTAGLIVRMFIIQHDCGHGSFFKSQKWNDRVGAVCGVFTLVPYYHWRKMHAIHHAHSGKLDESEMRGIGEIETKTVEEYFSSSKWQQLAYRYYRNTFFLIGIGAFIGFVFLYRFPVKLTKEKGWKKERNSVYWTNIGILLLYGSLVWTIGLKSFLLVQIPVIYIATVVGVWFFFVQHQYEDAYYAREDEWRYEYAALKGCSYYKLPRILQWFSGNIGFHHIHHLSPKIPNYKLQECHEQNVSFQDVETMTIRSSFKTLKLGLWDEEQQRLISFDEAYERYGERYA